MGTFTMIQVLQAIALLCHVADSTYSYETNFRKQLKCQQEYISCVKKISPPSSAFSSYESPNYVDNLEKCILEKK